MLTAVLFVFHLMISRQHGMTDDYGIATILSNTCPENSLSLFVNAALCQAISAISSILPDSWNCYLLFEIEISAFAFFYMVYVSIRSLRIEYTAGLISVFALLAIPYCAWCINFTVVAAMCACSGGFGLLTQLARGKITVSRTAISVILIAVGFAIRWTAALLGAPLFVIAVLYTWFFTSKAPQTNTIMAVIPFLVVIMCCGGLRLYDSFIWSQPENAEWKAYNNARNQVQDYPMKSFDDVGVQLNEAGITANDYYMALNWISNDPGYFTTDLFQTMSEIGSANELHTFKTLKSSAKTYLKGLIKDSTLVPALLIGLFSLVLAASSFRRRDYFYLVAQLVCVAIMLLFFKEMGRLPTRVEYPIWMYLTISASMTGYVDDRVQNSKHAARPAAALTISRTLFGMLALIIAASLIVVDYSPDLDPGMPSTLVRSEPEYIHPIEAYVRNHPDDVFVMGRKTRNEMREPYQLKTLPSEDVFLRTVVLGGWIGSSPDKLNSYKQLGIPNVISDMPTNPNCYLIASEKGVQNILLRYIQEHHYPEAYYEKVASIPATNNSSTYYVFKYHVKSGTTKDPVQPSQVTEPENPLEQHAETWESEKSRDLDEPWEFGEQSNQSNQPVDRQSNQPEEQSGEQQYDQSGEDHGQVDNQPDMQTGNDSNQAGEQSGGKAGQSDNISDQPSKSEEQSGEQKYDQSGEDHGQVDNQPDMQTGNDSNQAGEQSGGKAGQSDNISDQPSKSEEQAIQLDDAFAQS